MRCHICGSYQAGWLVRKTSDDPYICVLCLFASLADAERILEKINTLCSDSDERPVGPRTIAEIAQKALSRIRRSLGKEEKHD